MYIQIIMIVVSIAIILEGINLISNTSKALARNFSRTARLLGITGIITGIICFILSININRISKSDSDTTVMIFILILSVATRFIVNTILKDIRE